MLFQLLELLRAGGTRRVDDLARALNTTPGLVEAMLEDLNRLGYLKQLGDQCSSACDSCPMGGGCAVGQGDAGRVWTLVDSKDGAKS